MKIKFALLSSIGLGLVLSSNIEIEKSPDQDPVLESKKSQEIKALGPDEQVELILNCRELMTRGDNAAIRGVLMLMDVNGENWTELTADPECAPYFRAKCDTIGAKHFSQILAEGGEWPEDAATPDLRLSKMLELGWFDTFEAFEAAKAEHISYMVKVPLIKSRNWANINGEVLKEMLKEQSIFGDLPNPSGKVKAGLMKLLKSSDFATGLNWLIFDSTVFNIAVRERNEKLWDQLADTFVSIVPNLEGSNNSMSMIWALRTEMLVKFLLSRSDGSISVEATLRVIRKLKDARSSMYERSDDENVRSMLRYICPEVRQLLENFGKQEEIGMDYGELFSIEAVEKNEDGFDNYPNEPLSLETFSTIVQRALPEQPARTAVVDFVLLYPVNSDDLLSQAPLVNYIFEKAMIELGNYLETVKEDTIHLTFPITLLKWCSKLLTIKRDQGLDCANIIREALEKCDHRLPSRLIQSHYGTMDIEPILYSMAKYPSDLRVLASLPMPDKRYTLQIEYKGALGFDFRETLGFINQSIEAIISPHLMIGMTDAIDEGGPRRGWTEQMFNELMDLNIIVPLSKTEPLKKKIAFMTSREVGYFIGVMMGKLFQSGLTFHFIMDPEWYSVLLDMNKSDEEIEEFWRRENSEELKLLWDMYMMGRVDEQAFMEEAREDLCFSLPKNLRFLSFNHGCNIFNGPDNQMLTETRSLHDVTKLELAEIYEELVRLGVNEYKHLLGEIRRGLGLIFDLRFLKFIQDETVIVRTFNMGKVDLTLLKENIHFVDGHAMIPSLIPGVDVSAEEAFLDLLEAIAEDVDLMNKLIGVWTGAMTTKPEKLIVSFRRPDDVHDVKTTIASFKGLVKGQFSTITERDDESDLVERMNELNLKSEEELQDSSQTEGKVQIRGLGGLYDDDNNNNNNAMNNDIIIERIEDVPVDNSDVSMTEADGNVHTTEQVEIPQQKSESKPVDETLVMPTPDDERLQRKLANSIVAGAAEFVKAVAFVERKQRERLGGDDAQEAVFDPFKEEREIIVPKSATCGRALTLPRSDTAGMILQVFLLLNSVLNEYFDNRAPTNNH